MVPAGEIRTGMALRLEGEVFRVLGSETHKGGGKMGGVVHTRLESVRTGGRTERRFRPDERLEEVHLERRPLTFLYLEGETLIFMDPDTFEQVSVAGEILGPLVAFLEENAQVPVEFFEGHPVRVVLPEFVDVRVKTTAPATKQGEQSTWKAATLENGLEIQVPLFIAPGDTIRLEAATRLYSERVRDKAHS